MIESRLLPKTETPRDQKPLVICIDDEPRVLAALRRQLSGEPYDTVFTGKPQKVLELIDRVPVSVVIADQRMPGILGTDLLRIVHRRSPRTAGMILTAYSTQEDISAARAEGTVRCLLRKPWEDAEIRDAIHQLLSPPSRDGKTGQRERPASTASPARAVLRMSCRGKSSDDILSEAAGFLARPGTPRRSLVLFLEDLPLLVGSSSRLLTDLLSTIGQSKLPVALVDPSGIAEAYLDVVGVFVPLVVVRSVKDLPEPKRVLLVGPGVDFVGLHRWIEAAGHFWAQAPSPLEALRRLMSGTFDVVLLGHVFPDERNVELARRVLERATGVSIRRWARNAGSSVSQFLEGIQES
jgi:CheY-like chemotaxis protein